MVKYHSGLIILLFFALLLTPYALGAASFDTSQTSLSSDSKKISNTAYSNTQNTKSNAYTVTSNTQNYQQKTNTPSVSYPPQEAVINAYSPKNTQGSIPPITFLNDQDVNTKGFVDKGIQTPGSRAYDTMTQKDLDMKVPDMSFLGKNLIRAPEDKPKRKKEDYYPGPSYSNDDVAEHYGRRKEEDVVFTYEPEAYR